MTTIKSVVKATEILKNVTAFHAVLKEFTAKNNISMFDAIGHESRIMGYYLKELKEWLEDLDCSCNRIEHLLIAVPQLYRARRYSYKMACTKGGKWCDINLQEDCDYQESDKEMEGLKERISEKIRMVCYHAERVTELMNTAIKKAAGKGLKIN